MEAWQRTGKQIRKDCRGVNRYVNNCLFIRSSIISKFTLEGQYKTKGA